MKSYNGFQPELRGKALAWLKGEWAAGRRVKQTVCDACGQTECVGAHSECYAEPFGPHIGLHYVCFVCHMMIHCRFRNPQAWAQYRVLVRAGGQARPVGWNFPEFAQTYLDRPHNEWPARYVFHSRDETLLDRIDSGEQLKADDALRIDSAMEMDAGRLFA